MSKNFKTEAIKYLTLPEVQSVLKAKRAEDIRVSYLAQGEYNINFMLESPGTKAVLRLNTASQMHLDNQIRYEYRTLEILERTRVAPRPLYCDDSLSVSPYGMLLMEYIPGRWLDYEQDFLLAADVFARTHQIKYFPNSGIIAAPNPATEILNECQNMASVFLHSEFGDPNIKKLVESIIKKIETIITPLREPFDMNRLVLNNTEVNSSNFLCNKMTGEMILVDWEKAIFSVPTQDLSHFLVPTTTFWKTGFFFSKEQVDQFIRRYCDQTHEPFSEIRDQLDIFWYVTCLRGVTWCAMAYVEYQQPDRPLKNEFTFGKIQKYIEEDFIRRVFKRIL
jgi:thiamine kinase-like enzyme